METNGGSPGAGVGGFALVIGSPCLAATIAGLLHLTQNRFDLTLLLWGNAPPAVVGSAVGGFLLGGAPVWRFAGAVVGLLGYYMMVGCFGLLPWQEGFGPG